MCVRVHVQGQVQSGMRSGIRIAQGNYIRLTVSKPVPVQVDGEPWIQPPGHIIISAAGPKVFVPPGCRSPTPLLRPPFVPSVQYISVTCGVLPVYCRCPPEACSSCTCTSDSARMSLTDWCTWLYLRSTGAVV